MTLPTHASTGSDVIIIGGGLIGLSIAAELEDRGFAVILLDAGHTGVASTAAAGMLAPGVELSARADEARRPEERERLTLAHRFSEVSRDRFPDFLARISESSGRDIPANDRGVLQIAPGEADAVRLRERMGTSAEWLEPAELRRLQPGLRPVRGAVFHPRDGAVDNVALVEALHSLLRQKARVQMVTGRATRLEALGRGVRVHIAGGPSMEAARVVLAAGAWAPLLEGLPRDVPIEPVRGQMLSVAAGGLEHVVYGPNGYVVPRGGRVLVGATMESVGFDPDTTDEGIERTRASGESIFPSLRGAGELSRWSGLRPLTPDLLPILGTDPDWPALVYACGHSRNGVLLAPATASAIGRLMAGEDHSMLAPFSIMRPSLRAPRA